MRLNKTSLCLTVLVMLVMVSGCSRDSWDITNPGLGEESNTEFSFTLSSPTAVDGDVVYISGSVVPGYQQDPNIMVLFGTFQDGEVIGTFGRQVWGNEKFNVGFWRKDSDNRYHRMLDVSVNGVDLNAIQATEFEIYREFQLYVEDGVLKIDPMTEVDDLVEVQVWYTGNSFPQDYMNNPANPDVPVFWMGTWTTFRFAPHTTYWENGMWTAKFYVARDAVTYLRLQLADGTELRSGVYVGLPGDFEHATELINLVDLGGGWTVFTFMLNQLDAIANLWPEDDRLYGIEIGD